MARPDSHNSNRQARQGGGPGGKGSRPQPHQHSVALRTCHAPGDEPITIESYLKLNEPFRIERASVNRLKRREINPKEAFTVRDGSGSYVRASLKELNANGGLAVPYERMERSPEPTIDITLACSVLARQRMIFVMQKATELGVTRIVPLLTDHSVPAQGLEHERANSWPAQVIRAAKQCRRASLPHVLPPVTLDLFLTSAIFMSADLRVVLDDRNVPAPSPAESPRRIVLLVGPEGGFSNAERSSLADRAHSWMLGGRILRAETAVIVGLTAIQMRWGDFLG
ncbi:MAG TPA: RsmE family RNA methyltransferase [Tepidisphaeraceae bacterium]|nr:RsmE family RNA methyltransferase [Tepidisphaeraceae bacterium]